MPVQRRGSRTVWLANQLTATDAATDLHNLEYATASNIGITQVGHGAIMSQHKKIKIYEYFGIQGILLFCMKMNTNIVVSNSI